eukprot:4778908-Alexandrium_andersonii.AAC.1
MHACPKCEKTYPVGAEERVECCLSMAQQNNIRRALLRGPSVRPLLRARASAKVVKNGPTEREQHTRSGMIAGTVLYAVAQNEREPR